MLAYRIIDEVRNTSTLMWQDNWGLHIKPMNEPQQDYPNASYNAIYYTLKAFEDKGYSIEHLN